MKQTPRPFFIFCSALFLLLFPGLALPALAHRVQVFAYSSGNEIVVEASTGKDQPVVRGSEVTVSSGIKRDVLLRGETDIQGRFRFPMPALSADTSLLITVNSGLGHLGSRVLTPEDLKQQQSPEPHETAQSLAEGARDAGEGALSPEEQRLAELVARAVAQEVEPLKRMLIKEMDKGPSLQEIIGGIGWLVGIGGLLTALKKKR